jgi:uncharacterized protein YbbC (DUF1343 family)
LNQRNPEIGIARSKGNIMVTMSTATTRLGLEVFLDEQFEMVDGLRVGLVTSATSTDSKLVNTVHRLYSHPAVHLVALFGPEHGFRGEGQSKEEIGISIDPFTKLPVYSLYGKTYKPTPEMLDNIDVLVVDLQDVGVRFYTRLSTLAYVLQASAERKIQVIVLDRPAPINGLMVEGPVLDTGYSSFMGMYPIPIRHGMTIGEFAQLVNEAFSIRCRLAVVPMQSWRRSMWFDQTNLPYVPTSPNLPTLDTLTVYPGTCLIEGTNLSEGRGTTKPFEYIGAPWIEAESLADHLNALNLRGVRFRSVYFTPTFGKYQGELCAGIHVFVTDRGEFRSIEVVLHLIRQIKMEYPDKFVWQEPEIPDGHYHIDLLCGNSKVRGYIDTGKPLSTLFRQWQDEIQAFLRMRADFLLYRD